MSIEQRLSCVIFGMFYSIAMGLVLLSIVACPVMIGLGIYFAMRLLGLH